MEEQQRLADERRRFLDSQRRLQAAAVEEKRRKEEQQRLADERRRSLDSQRRLQAVALEQKRRKDMEDHKKKFGKRAAIVFRGTDEVAGRCSGTEPSKGLRGTQKT